MERFKSWALWTAIAALVVFCVNEFAGIDISDTVDGLLNVLLLVVRSLCLKRKWLNTYALTSRCLSG